MSQKRSNDSNFAGFLDNYRAKNLASIEISVKSKLDIILQTIKKLRDSLNEKEKKDFKSLTVLEQCEEILKRSFNDDLIEVLKDFGKHLDLNIEVLTSEINEDIDKRKLVEIVYNYGEIAKMSDETDLVEVALSLGESLPEGKE